MQSLWELGWWGLLRLTPLLNTHHTGPGSLPHVGLPGSGPVHPWQSGSHWITEQICWTKQGQVQELFLMVGLQDWLLVEVGAGVQVQTILRGFLTLEL